MVFVFGFVLLAAGMWRYGHEPDKASNLPLMPDDLSTLEPRLSQKIRTLVQAVRAHGDDADAHGRLGVLYEAHGFTDLARARYAAAYDADRRNVRWRYLWAAVAEAAGDATGAEQALRDVIAREPEYAPAHERLGRLLLERGRHAEAGALFERIIELAPAEATGYIGLARVKLMTQKPEDALRYVSQALSIVPQGPEALHLAGGTYRALGRSEDAASVFAQADLITRHAGICDQTISAGPINLKDPWRRVVDEARLTWWGRLANAKRPMQEGRPAEAAERIEALLADYPDQAEIMSALAQVYHLLERRDDAHRLLARAVEADPSHADAYLLRAAILSAEGRVEEATQHAKDAVAVAPGSARALAVHGKLSMQLGRFEEALASLRESRRLDPYHADVHDALAMVLVRLERWAEAIDVYEAIVAIRPRSVMDWYRLGLLYSRVRRTGDAIEAFETALELDPQNMSIQRSLRRVMGEAPGP